MHSVWNRNPSSAREPSRVMQNLMSDYHIRYGGYGGIDYYVIADSYIALFLRFSTCG